LESYGRLLEALQYDDRTYNEHLFRVPHDWTIVPRAWLGVVMQAMLVKAVSATAGAAFALCVAVSKPASRLPRAFLLASTWMTLFGPATEIPTYTLLAPAAAWWAVTRRSVGSYIFVALLTAPILRAIFPSSEVLPCRTAAPLAAVSLLLDLAVMNLRCAPKQIPGDTIAILQHRSLWYDHRSTASHRILLPRPDSSGRRRPSVV
jgi:hypothetical protein